MEAAEKVKSPLKKRIKGSNRTFNKRRITELGANGFCHIVLIGIIFLIIFPMIERVLTTFLSYEDLMDKTVKYIARNFSLNTLVRTMGVLDYWQTLLNTVFLCLVVAILQTFISTFVAYGFARYKFPGRGLLFAIVLAVLLIPPQVIMTSLYIDFTFFEPLNTITFGLTGLLGISTPIVDITNGIWPFILMSVFAFGFKNSLYIYMMRQFFRGLPTEIEEAGMIDGCTNIGIFFRLMLPNAVPMMVTIFLFSFSWQWTDNYYSALFLRDDSFQVLTNKLAVIPGFGVGDPSNYYTEVFRSAMNGTGIILTILPLIVIYLFGQRFFVQGVSQSGIVG